MHLFKVLGLVLAALFFVTSCKKKNTKGDFGLERSETLRLRVSSEPPSLDWHKASDTDSSMITQNLMEGLVVFDYAGGEVNVAPALAESWNALEQSKKWQFKIREGVKWSDGQPFEPKHILDGWERLLNPMTASPYAYYLYALKNARAYNEGKLKDFSQVGVSIKGHVLTVDLEAPMKFPFLLTHPSTFPVRVDVVNRFGDKWTEPRNIVTLGPYNLKKWTHDQALVMSKSDNYYGSPAKTKNIIFYVVKEHQTAINLFDIGKLDVIRNLPPKDLGALKKRKEYFKYSILSTYYYGFNVTKSPMDNVQVRKAVSHAIDKKQIVKILQGGQKPLSGWVPEGMFGYDSNVGLEFNLEKAKAYLKEAGYGEGNPFPKIELSFNTLEAHKTIAENIQAQLKKNLGIQLEIRNEEWKVYLNKVKTDATQIYRMGWVADYPDPNNFFNILLSYSDNNYTKWKNKKYDKLIEEAVGVSDKSKRLELYKKAHTILVEEDVPVLPLYNQVAQHLIADRVVSFPTNVMNEFRFKNTSLQ